MKTGTGQRSTIHGLPIHGLRSTAHGPEETLFHARQVSRSSGRCLRGRGEHRAERRPRHAFDALREFACRDGADAIRLNAYLAFDEERSHRDHDYRSRATRYHFALRDVGFKVIEKPVQWYTNEDGVRVSKANSDLDLAVDMLLQSAKLDRVVLVSGDGDFVQVVRALQNMGCRVELIGFQNVSYDLRCESDVFVSGYLIPGLLPVLAKTVTPCRSSRRPGARPACASAAPATTTTPRRASASCAT